MSTTLVENRHGQKLTFQQVSKGNKSKSNLTELNATDALDTGFMSHNDWVAHGTRYGYIQKMVTHWKPKTVLDVGCGRFPMLNFFWKNRSVSQFDYTGIDLRANPRWFEHLRWNKSDVTLVQADLVLDEVPVVSSDLVVCTEVFEHVPTNKAKEFAARLYSWTNRGGILVFSTPNAGVSKSTADNHKDEDGNSREWRYHDKLDLLSSVGFELENSYGTFIAKSRIPEVFWTDETRKAAEFLPHAMFTVYAAAGFPEQSNNALFVMRKPE